MASFTWRGSAAVVRQVDTFTIGGTVEVGDIFTITIGGSTFTYTAASTTIATEAAAMRTALSAAITLGTYPEFTGLVAAYVSGGAFTLTGKDDGSPFTATAATTEAGGGAADAQTFVKTATTAAESPNHWSVAANWEGLAIPTSSGSNDVFLDNSDVPVKWGMDQSAVTVGSLTVSASFTNGGQVGLPQWHEDGYREYRDDYLKISATTVTIGRGDGSGSDRIKLNFGSVQTAVTVHGSDTGAEEADGIPAVLLLGTHASNTLAVLGGSVGVAFFGGEVSTVATLRALAGDCITGSGVTLTTVQHSGSGNLTIQSACTTLTKDPSAGTTVVYGAGAIATANVYGGELDHRGTGTISTLVVGARAFANFDNHSAAIIVSASTFYAGAKVRDRNKRVTWTADPATPGCTYADLDLDLGVGRVANLSA